MQQRARLHIKLMHRHVRRQRAASLIERIERIDIAGTEMPAEKRGEKTIFQSGLRLRSSQRQRGIERHRSPGIVLHHFIQGIEQAMRFAQTQGRGNAQVRAQLLGDQPRAGIGIG